MIKITTAVAILALLSSCTSVRPLVGEDTSSSPSVAAVPEITIETQQSAEEVAEAETEAFEVDGTRDVYTDNDKISDDNITLEYEPQHYDFWLNYFTKRDQERFGRHLRNGYKYKQLVFHILKEHGLPTDLFYVGLIESGYNNRIKSHAGAAGPWQFMPKTARHYGLRVDSQVDERWNIYKSTHAAARYFSDLYNIFGSWELAMCAYNAGEYRIIRAIRKGRTRSYRELVQKKLIPKETAYYIPKVAAARSLVQSEEKFGYFHGKDQDSLYGQASLVELNESFSLKSVSKLSHVPIKTLSEMNPDIKKDYVRVRGAYGILVPKIHASKLAGLDLPKLKIPARYTASSATSHKVRRGENLSVIAKRYKVSVKSLKSLNRIRGSRIYVGQKLKLPGSARGVASSEKSAVHVVRRGENLSLIAKKYGVSLSQIRRSNRMRGSRIFPGQRLELPGVSVTFYRVRAGDNLTAIAKRFGVSVSDIKRSNDLPNSVIYPNQKLKIPSES